MVWVVDLYRKVCVNVMGSYGIGSWDLPYGKRARMVCS